jgi:hypothetical protein
MHDFESFLNFISIFSKTLAVIIIFDQQRRQRQQALSMFPIASIAYYHKIVEILENAPELQQSISGICKQVSVIMLIASII